MYNLPSRSATWIVTLLLSCAFMPLAPAQDEDDFDWSSAETVDLLIEVNDDLKANREGSEEYRHAAQFWIPIVEDRFRNTTNDDPYRDLLAHRLSTLFERTGQRAQARQIYQQISDYSGGHPSTRLGACRRSAELAVELGLSPDEILRPLDHFSELVEQFRIEGVGPLDDVLVRQYEEIDYHKYELLATRALAILRHPGDDIIVTEKDGYHILEQSGVFLESYIAGRIDDGVSSEDFSSYGHQSIPQLTNTISLLELDIAEHYQRMNNKSAERLARRRVVSALRRYLIDLPDAWTLAPNFADRFAKMLLQQEEMLLPTMDDFLTVADEIAQAANARTVLLPAYLMVLAWKTEPQKLQSAEDLHQYDIAAWLYMLAMELERKSDPEDYLKTPNYQSSVIRGAKVAIALGEMDRAKELILEIERIKAEDPEIGSVETGWILEAQSAYAVAQGNRATELVLEPDTKIEGVNEQPETTANTDPPATSAGEESLDSDLNPLDINSNSANPELAIPTQAVITHHPTTPPHSQPSSTSTRMRAVFASLAGGTILFLIATILLMRQQRVG